jgi:short subunit dehydrogenase-like uncharacterized protein
VDSANNELRQLPLRLRFEIDRSGRRCGMSKQWMIYGAYGYTGQLIVQEALCRGLRPVIAGRSEERLRPLATELGLDYRTFDVSQASAGLSDMTVLLNCAGPFSATAKPLVEACLEARTHYVDITGEIPVFQYCHRQDARARKAGVVLCPGAGFDIVPTDCLAAMLQERLPDAQQIDLAFQLDTRPSIGTLKTAIEGIGVGGMVRRDHRLVQVPMGYRMRRIEFPRGRRWAVTIPWGDVFTAGISTGVPNGMVYMAVPLPVAVILRATSPLRGMLASRCAQEWLRRIAERRLSGGPDKQARAAQHSELWGEATSAAGRSIIARMTAPNAYSLTADTAVEIAAHCLSITDISGYTTPSLLMGSDFIATRPGIQLEFVRPLP